MGVADVKGEKWYRIQNQWVSAGVDEFDNPLGPPLMQLYIREFTVERETPKGVWLTTTFFRRFCLKKCRKRFACPSLEEALESFRARKKAQIRILSRQIAGAERGLELAEREVARRLGKKDSPKLGFDPLTMWAE